MSNIIYYIILTIACIMAVIRIKHDNRLLVFSILLICTLIEELVFEFLEQTHRSERFYFIYHIYAPIYYALFAYYYSLTIPQGVARILMRISIPIFTIATIWISLSAKSLNSFPSIQLDIIGILLIIDSLIALFQLDVENHVPIFRKPVFWIGVSTLLFYSILFSLYGFENYLIQHNPKLINRLTTLINNNLNYLYYLLIVIGLLCSKPTEKYSLRSY